MSTLASQARLPAWLVLPLATHQPPAGQPASPSLPCVFHPTPEGALITGSDLTTALLRTLE